MASLLQKSTPWIEDSFVYACSFDASRCDGEDNGSESDFNDDEEMEPQTENTIPAGLHDDDSRDGNSGRNKPPPSRCGKIVQIIDRGGDPNFYVVQRQQQQSNGKHNNDRCPPYLILHDGQYSTIAFLSEEAYHSSMMRQDASVRGTKQPKAIPRKSLISISQFTISTIKCCAQQQHNEHQHQSTNNANEDILPLQLVRPDMPRDHLTQVKMSINTNLLLCLYLLGPITFIGAENQGLIGDAINVNCSIKVRRVLISHMAQFERVHKEHTNVCVNTEEEEEEEDYQHWTMVQRLEACHCYYQLLKERQGGTIPVWPWESRLVGGETDDDGEKGETASASDDEVVDVTVNQSSSAAAAATTTVSLAASPGRVQRMIHKYENLEELLQEGDDQKEEEEDVAEAADVEDKRAGKASTGTNLAKWDSEEDQVEDEEDLDDAVGDKTRAARASTGTYLAQWDSEDDQEEEEEMGEGTKGNTSEHVQQQRETEEEGEEKENDTSANKADAPIEQGNVAELFDNFEDINEVLDLEEDEPVIDEEEEASSSANVMLESNDNIADSDSVAENIPGQGEDNETTEDRAGYDNTQEDNAATFVGIDQMIVDSDVDEGEVEDEEDEQAPLLTQQDFDVDKDEESESDSDILEPTQEVTESQILLPLVKVNKQSTKLSRGNGHTKEIVESQIAFPPPNDTRSSDEEDDGNNGTESQIPFPTRSKYLNKQSLDESESEDEEDDDNNGTESQIPFPLRRKQLNAQSSDGPESKDEENDIGTESQIPFPPRRKQLNTQSSDGSGNEDEENGGNIGAESQIPFLEKQVTEKGHSPRKPNADVVNIRQPVRPKRKDVIIYDSDDDWMRIRKVKPSAKPTKRAPSVQSQMAGEGSEEITPTNVLDTSQITINSDNVTGEEDEEVITGVSEKEMHQPGSISSAQMGPSSSVAKAARSLVPAAASSTTRRNDHRVRFAVENTDQNEHSKPLSIADAPAPPAPVPVTNHRELFTSVSNKASKIIMQSIGASNEPASRKRNACEDERETKRKKRFSFDTLFTSVMRLWPPHPGDNGEEEGQI